MPNHVLQLDCTFNDGDVELDFSSAPFAGAYSEIWMEVMVAFDATYLAALAAQAFSTVLAQFYPSDFRGGGVVPDIEITPVGSAGKFTTFPVPAAPLTAASALQWFCLKAHVVAGSPPTYEFWVNGFSIGAIDMTGTEMADITLFDLESSGLATPGLVFFDTVKIGTTEGASDIFTDDFEGTLAGWNSFVSGSATIVADPGIAACAITPPPPPAGIVRITEPPWRFVVADVVFNGSSPPGFSTLTFLDHRAINRQVRYYLRQAATCAGRVAADDAEINILGLDGEPFLAEGVRMLIGLRREGGTPPWKVRFAGPILQASRLVENDVPWVDFTAYSVRQLLYKRPVRNGSGLLLSNKGLTFRGVKGNTILLALLNRTFVADGWHFIDTTTGTIEDTDPIDINFQQGSSVGEALDQLELTGTMDVLLPAVYDPVASPGILAKLNVHVLAGSVKHGAIMSWDMAGRTLAGINWLEDGQQRENHVELYTSDGLPTPTADDTDSNLKYGPYWGQQNYPVQTQVAALEAAALVRLLTHKDHPETIELSPLPQNAPIPFNEYFLADWLPTYASKRLGKTLSKSLRVYEIDLDLADDYGETAHLLTSANLDPPKPPGFAVAITGGTDSGDTLTAEIIT